MACCKINIFISCNIQSCRYDMGRGDRRRFQNRYFCPSLLKYELIQSLFVVRYQDTRLKDSWLKRTQDRKDTRPKEHTAERVKLDWGLKLGLGLELVFCLAYSKQQSLTLWPFTFLIYIYLY